MGKSLFSKWCWKNWTTTCKSMKLEQPSHTGRNAKWGIQNSTTTSEDNLEVFTKLSILLPTAFLDMYPKELKTYVQTKSYTWMFTAALLIFLKTWAPPRCHTWINELWFIQMM